MSLVGQDPQRRSLVRPAARDRALRLLPAVLRTCLAGWIALSCYLFLAPDPQELSRGVDPGAGHALLFAAIGATALAAHLLRRLTLTAAAVAWLFAAGVAGGVAAEAAQHVLATGRSAQWSDVVADAAGMAAGLAAVAGLHRLVRQANVVAAVTAVASAVLLVVIAIATLGGH